jgi:hypothetical protein
MGYSTDFEGKLDFSRVLTLAEKLELDEISETDWRHDGKKPGYFCQWQSNKTGTALIWDGGEKFYDYIEWLNWLIDNFFAPKHIKLTGSILWIGESKGDLGKISVKNNVVTIKKGKIIYE